ncbi:GNAT family N-acetyltransferase [Flagellimonas baculiformis]|uniref:GNAT family N-acetyltransferase n=1 Tax=Flagellimonas baculiformis TaxID=3067310 RepID=UPI00296F8810|nr:GNAT family N-acetyltransferase [Muricauda sp. D6]
MLEVITHKNDWDRTVKRFGEIDFYHSFDYHKANIKEDEKAVLLSYTSNGVSIAFPLVIRPINDSGYFDVTSVYGYVGPLVTKMDGWKNLLPEWHRQLAQFFAKNRIVSAFSSMNPFISEQNSLLVGFGDIENLGRIVYFDLGKPDDHLEEYSKTTLRYVKRNQQLFDIQEGKTEQDAKKFMDIYYQTMDRIHAEPNYYFKLPYFMDLVQNENFDARFVFAVSKDSKEVASGAFIVATQNHIIQYHLSGTSDKYRHLSPIRTVIDHVRRQGASNGHRYFNLGGGVGSKNDSLYEFKASFSQNSAPFQVWKFIADREAYDRLCKRYSPEPNSGKPNYFPKYRSNLK